MFSSENWFGASSFYNGVIGQSLRLSAGSNYKLDRQMVTPTSVTGTICTASWWMKKSAHGTVQSFIQCRDNQSSGNYSAYWTYDTGFGSNDHHSFRNEVDSLHIGTDTSVVPYRDASGWYHVVIRYDSTQSTASDRIRIYKNGTLQNSTFATTTYPSQNHVDTFWNNAGEHLILFGNGEDSGDSFDGYIAEFNWVDGQSLAPETFGELKNGVWIPKKITLSTSDYGLNGSRYTFADSSDIGKDTSGVGNDLDRVSNLSAHDVVPDSPENNFATMNPLDNYNTGVTYSEGNLKWTIGVADGAGRATFVMTSGKWYTEFLTNADYIGVVSGNADITAVNGSQTVFYAGDGTKRVNGSSSSYGASYSDGDIIGIALNMDDEEVTFYKNNSSQGTISLTSVGNEGYTVSPASGAGSKNATANFGQDSSFAGVKTAQGNTDGNDIGDFYYAPPSGFLAMCSSNLPEPTISPNADTQADDYFNTVLYTGNGSSSSATQDISGVGFKPDFLWTKRRNSSASHNLRDSSRGVLKHLQSDGTGSEDTESDAGVTAFLDDGFRLKGTNAGSGQVNANGGTFVAWNWKANGSQTSSNSDGSITSTVQANTDAGFSIVTYTGNATAGATVGHGLGATPHLIIAKNRDDSDGWRTYHNTGSSEILLFLHSTSAQGSSSSFTDNWTDTSPTTSVFSIGTDAGVNTSSEDYVAYCFTSIEGYSKFGKYTGNGNADGTFVFTNFAVKWLMVKRTDSADDWFIHDSTRDTFNINTHLLYANASNAEYDATGDADNSPHDFTSNGFKLRSSNANWNASSGTYIYMAFAEAPFKYALGR